MEHRRERVAGGRECAEHHADRNLQQIFAFKRRRISSICRMTRITWKMTVATPISIPQTQVMVYGMELTGDTPRLDLTDSAMPIVMTKKPPK